MKKISKNEIKELVLQNIVKCIISYDIFRAFSFKELRVNFYIDNTIKIKNKETYQTIKEFKINPDKTCDIEYTCRFALILYKYLDFKSKKLKDL
ncbi:TPA: hypothetical protein RTG66_001577 [Campylobacter jejuni]|nr:hypothetical protein [Campylobacter jejuni]